MEEKATRKRNMDWPIIWWTLAFCTVYAVVRYHILGPVPAKDFPLFILNKILSMSALILLAFNFTFGPLRRLGVNVPDSWLRGRRLIGIIGFIQVFMHLIISLLLFNPSFYSKFFSEDGRLTAVVAISMLGGIFAFVFLWVYNISFNSNFRKDKDLIGFITSRKVLLIAFSFSGIHLFFIGFEGWMKPEGWHGGVPPISLVAFTLFAIGFVINLFGRTDPE